MTDTRCWVTYDNDRVLLKKVNDGWFTENDTLNFPINNFPALPANSPYWPNILKEWCGKNAIKFKWDDTLTVSARVKKHQIEEFIHYQ